MYKLAKQIITLILTLSIATCGFNISPAMAQGSNNLVFYPVPTKFKPCTIKLLAAVSIDYNRIHRIVLRPKQVDIVMSDETISFLFYTHDDAIYSVSKLTNPPHCRENKDEKKAPTQGTKREADRNSPKQT